MLKYALIVFAVAAVGGLTLAVSVLRGKLAPWALSLAHAALGATGIGLLGYGMMQGATATRVTIALALFVLAALGGFYLASIHRQQRIAPKGVVLAHAGVAVVGFLILLSTVFAV